MDEYIEKQKAVDLLIELEKEFQQFKPFNGFEHAMYRELCEAKIAIEKLPAADVVPVVHGRWIDDGRGIIICPECKRGYNLHAKYTHYCPNCGAKMDGGDNNEKSV